jgi:hypothetical protein
MAFDVADAGDPPMLAALQAMGGREIIIHLVGGGQIGGRVDRVDREGLVYLDTTLQQARPSPLVQGQMVMAESPAEVMIDVSTIAAVISAKHPNGPVKPPPGGGGLGP